MTSGEVSVIPFWTPELMDSVKKNDFRMSFSTPTADITAICIVKYIDGAWKGTIINEFGLKVLDFVSTPEKCTLVNVISFLDKWYIKKVMASGIQFIMEIDNAAYTIVAQSNRSFVQDTLVVTYKKEKEFQRFPDGTIQYKNHKRALTYSFKKINQ
jgi:hypothetical protein